MTETSDRWLPEPLMTIDMPGDRAPLVFPSSGSFLHLDGVPWYEAPLPRRWHRCRPQSKGRIGLETIERCACGAVNMRDPRHPESIWIEKNQTRKAQRRSR